MKFHKTQLKGAYIIELEKHEDERGFFARTFCQEEFKAHGIDFPVVQCNISFNKKKGTLRGMHYQVAPYEEAKLVHCTMGAIYDVIIDMRPEPPTYKQWLAVVLMATDFDATTLVSHLSTLNSQPIISAPGSLLYIPKGFAHGFQTLEDDTEVFYQMSEFYHPECARGVRWDDPVIRIEWPIADPILSDKDRSYVNVDGNVVTNHPSPTMLSIGDSQRAPEMRIALFAADKVGLEVARFFGATREPLACLVVDAGDPKGLNRDIIEASGVARDLIFSSDDLASPKTVEQLRYISLDLGLLAWWPYILQRSILNVVRLGFLNFHPSLLPYCRGKDPNFWAIVEEKPFGVTIHWVSERIDAGEIAFQAEIPVLWEDTGETLYKKAQQRIIELFIENYPRIKSGDIPCVPQSEADATFHRRSELHLASRIELDKTYTARHLLNLLRARTFAPHPGCWFEVNGYRYQVRISIEKIEPAEDASR